MKLRSGVIFNVLYEVLLQSNFDRIKIKIKDWGDLCHVFYEKQTPTDEEIKTTWVLFTDGKRKL